jgi:hypothetical protein
MTIVRIRSIVITRGAGATQTFFVGIARRFRHALASSHAASVAMVVMLSACAIGGGPTLGYRRDGFFAGVEANGGTLIEASGGGQLGPSGFEVYFRGDVASDVWDYNSTGPLLPAGRIGAGIVLGHETHAMFMSGAGAMHVVTTAAACADMTDLNRVGTAIGIEVQVRHTRDCEIVLTPRVVEALRACLKR